MGAGGRAQRAVGTAPDPALRGVVVVAHGAARRAMDERLEPLYRAIRRITGYPK
jgi:hypothetical protein